MRMMRKNVHPRGNIMAASRTVGAYGPEGAETPRVVFLLALSVFGVVGLRPLPAQTTGGWHLADVKSIVDPCTNPYYPCKKEGGAGAFTHTQLSSFSPAMHATSHSWTTPPAFLLPGQVIPMTVSIASVKSSCDCPAFGHATVAYWSFGADPKTPGETRIADTGQLFNNHPAGTKLEDRNEAHSAPTKAPSKPGNIDKLYIHINCFTLTSSYWTYSYQWTTGTPRVVTLSSPGQSMRPTGGSGSLSVKAPAGAGWTVATDATWITITSGTTGSGSATVSFTAAANTGAPRTGVIVIGGQIYTVNQSGTPSDTTAGCNYLVQASEQTAASGGGSAIIQIITAQNCAWTASSNATWVAIRSGASGTGNGAVSWAAEANPAATARSGSVVIAGQMVTINQAAGTPPGTPAVGTGGVVNTASYRSGSPPGGSLAQGSFFSIYGSDVGPEQFVKAEAYPIPTSLGDVTVTVTQGTTVMEAYPVFVSKGQMNAILPSRVPLGDGEVVVSYRGRTSPPAPVRIASANLGLFFQRTEGRDLAIAQNVASPTEYPLNTTTTPAKPGQIVILWGTGLGPIAGADNVAPGAGDLAAVPVEIMVGGKAARRIYAGRQPETAAVDNVYFVVPADVPLGCYVPVEVKAGGIAANPVVISITATGEPCQ